MGTKLEELCPLTTSDIAATLGSISVGDADFLRKLTEAGIVVCKPASGCLGKADWKEPLFVMRAQDTLAPWMVRQWARHFIMLNGTLNIASIDKSIPKLRMEVPDSVRIKHDEAMNLAAAMEAWPTRKIPT